MDFSELIQRRYSCRKYLEKPVPREMIDRCLDAARLAPSACNSQPWDFIAIDDREKIRSIVSRTMGGIYSSNSFVRKAPVLIVVRRLKSTYTARLGSMIRDLNYSLIDIGIAGEHLALQAAELGLGTCWLGWFNEKRLKNMLKVKKSDKIDVMISLGYPDPPLPSPRPKKRKVLSDTRRYWSASTDSP